MKKEKKYKQYLIAFLILTFSPIFIFIYNFKNNPISELQSDWADFGTFFSGILTPIISILSLIILIYIYFEIEKLSHKNNHNLYVLQKRIEIFEKLQFYRHEFYQQTRKLHQVKNQLTSNTYLADKKYINEYNLREVKEITNNCVDFYSFIKNFKIRYSHLFQNDFNSESFKNLSVNTNILESQMLDFYFDLLKNSPDRYSEGEQPFWNYEIILKELEKFSGELKLELKNIS